MQIQDEHMKKRCCFISAMCGLSLYSWYNYSLFDTIDNNPYTPYYQNGVLFLLYLGWDTYHMFASRVLYRTDLVIHHVFAFVLTGSSLNNCALSVSDYMIMECISLMNYTWRNNPRLLNMYRIACVLLVRVPLTLWFITYYHPTYLFPYWESTRTPSHYLYLYWLYKATYFFLLYDMLILWKIYNNNKRIAEKCA